MKIPTGMPATVTRVPTAGDIHPLQIMEVTQESTQILQAIAAFTALHRGLILHPCIHHHHVHSALALLPLHVHILPHHILVEEAVAAVAVAEDTDNRKWN
jgi:hypothetical protein